MTGHLESLMSKLSNLLDTACDVVDDFERHGEVMQADDNGEYGKTTAIFKLQKACNDVLDR